MSVRCKFIVTEKKENLDGSHQSSFTVIMNPVTSGSPENEMFYKYTPGGSLVLSIVNQAAADELAVGSPYYLDITRVESV
jgi:hypothetical protein